MRWAILFDAICLADIQPEISSEYGQFSAVQCSAAQSSAVQCSAVERGEHTKSANDTDPSFFPQEGVRWMRNMLFCLLVLSGTKSDCNLTSIGLEA
jgi:hypothetical protein